MFNSSGAQVAGGYNPGLRRLPGQPAGLRERRVRGLLRPDIRAVRGGARQERDARHLQFGRQGHRVALGRPRESDDGRRTRRDATEDQEGGDWTREGSHRRRHQR